MCIYIYICDSQHYVARFWTLSIAKRAPVFAQSK